MASDSVEYTTKKKPRRPKPEELELESLRIEPATNGYTVRKSMRVKRELRDVSGPYVWPESEEAVFTDTAAMFDYIRKCFGGAKK